MHIKNLLFGSTPKVSAPSGRESLQNWLPVKDIRGGVICTRDHHFVKILEVLPVNIYLKSPEEQREIISAFADYLKVAPDEMQFQVRTLRADTAPYIRQMTAYAAKEENDDCRAMIEDNIREIGSIIADSALCRRFFVIFRCDGGAVLTRLAAQKAVEYLQTEAETARKFLDACELTVVEPRYADNALLDLLYEILNKKTARRIKLPESVFDMVTAIHGVYEEE